MSVTITGLIVTILSAIVVQSNIDIPQENLNSFVETFGILIGIVIAWYGRFRQGDISIFGTRRRA